MQNKEGRAYKAVQAAGGPQAVADGLSISPKAVYNWTEYGRQVPAKYVIKLCQMTGGLFQPYDIRSDVFEETQRVEVTV